MIGISIEAVIFDLDGTLADTIGDLSRAVNSVLAARGFAEHPISTYKMMVGNGFSTLMKRALPPLAVENEELFAALSREATSAYSRMALETTKPFPGIGELLAILGEKNIACAVLSNKPDAMTRLMIATLFPNIHFLAVMGDLASRPRKPDPTSALAIAALAGLPAARIAFVGDSGVDMETGAASGMLALGAAWGYRSRQELAEHGAAGILANPSDLLAYL